ncbi:MAG: O-methyltransferase [Streptosporangiaceae bacterium]
MTNTLSAPQVSDVLRRLFAAADEQERREPLAPPPAGTAETRSALERALAYQDRFMPVSAAGGKLLYSLVRAIRPETVVEFGTSFGISTIFLAAAVTDNGTGRVLTTELSTEKAEAARSNLRQAGLDAPVTILAGDARQTLASVAGPIGLVLLDGWKDLCLPVLRLLEPELAPGALIVADDNKFVSMAEYLSYVRDPASNYVSVDFPVEDGMEISSWTGAPAS